MYPGSQLAFIKISDSTNRGKWTMAVKLGRLTIGRVTLGGKIPAFILGPCVIESEKFVRRMARRIGEMCAVEKVPFIFKASYDKANRTSVRSFRGIGVREGCALLAEIGR